MRLVQPLRGRWGRRRRGSPLTRLRQRHPPPHLATKNILHRLRRRRRFPSYRDGSRAPGKVDVPLGDQATSTARLACVELPTVSALSSQLGAARSALALSPTAATPTATMGCAMIAARVSAPSSTAAPASTATATLARRHC
ncbi:hypothetical protein ABZP36_030869 [Zizania latifolia]